MGTIVSSLLMLMHLVFRGLSLLKSLNWSDTSVSIEKPGFSHDDHEIYPSNFWTNYDNFRNAGAEAVALILLVGGIGQPILQQIVIPCLILKKIRCWLCNKKKKKNKKKSGEESSVLIRKKSNSSMSDSDSDSNSDSNKKRKKNKKYVVVNIEEEPRIGHLHFLSLAVQETTSKLSMTTSYVGIIMLSVISIDLSLPNIDVSAEVITKTLWGTEFYMFACYCSIFAVMVVRLRDGTLFGDDDEKEGEVSERC
mgnify:CR=1 FL=1|tara:strand:+ start:347 stop:1102 length:756 start_codon:yes stop_codon:yes gene_type:complete